jgi:hypothetical protein
VKGPDRTPTSAETGAIATSATPDLSPVPAPQSLVAVARVKNPAVVVDTVAGWAKFPIDLRALAQKNEPEAAQLLVFEAPIEAAVALDDKGLGNFPQPFAVVSIGVASVDGTVGFAKRHGQSVRMLRPGVYQISKGGSPVCAVAAAVGVAPARLVCGDRAEDVDALLPYATRGLPIEALGNADLHVRLSAEPLRRRYAKELRQLKTMATPFVLSELSMDSSRFDRALADAVHGIADELLALSEDVDAVKLEATVDRGQGTILAATSVTFRGKGSWTVQTMADAAKRSKGVPAAFWKLPKDSAMATYGVGANAKRYEAIRKTLAELADGALEKERVPRKVRDQLAELLLETWNTEGDVVYANGEVLPSTKAVAPGTGAAMREKIRKQLGWYVVGVDEKPAKYKAYLDKIVKLYNDAMLRKLVDKRLQVKPTELPKLTARASRAAGMPAGTTVYELGLSSAFFDKLEPPSPGGKKGAVPPLSLVVVLMPDGDQSWVGLSADEKTLSDRLVALKKGDSTLAAREGVGLLKTTKGVSGGFFTVGSLLQSLLEGLNESTGADATRALTLMPNHGETPIPMWTVVSPDGAAMTWSVRVPKAVVEDIAAVAPAIAAQKKGMMAIEEAPPPPPKVLKSPAGKTR